MKLQDTVTSVQKRLDDEDAITWSGAEIALYVKDGYDLYCRRTRVLFDIHIVENVPQAGNWTTDLERYLAEQSPGMGLTDEKLNFTAEDERDRGISGAVGGSTEGPVRSTSPSESIYYDDFAIPIGVATSRLPNSTVDVQRVTWDDVEIDPEEPAVIRRKDSQYERREGGDPRYYTFGKDGLLVLRLVPPGRGDADYATVDGSWGTMTQTDDTSITVQGSFGVLREVEGAFPAGGPHGTPTRQHPDEKNIKVEVSRLGRSLDHYEFEIPVMAIKYVIFWAMYRALKRDGDGQDLKFAQHYADRFEMGIMRAQSRLRKMQKELVLRMGQSQMDRESFGLGDPQLPYPYGPATGRIIQ